MGALRRIQMVWPTLFPKGHILWALHYRCESPPGDDITDNKPSSTARSAAGSCKGTRDLEGMGAWQRKSTREDLPFHIDYTKLRYMKASVKLLKSSDNLWCTWNMTVRFRTDLARLLKTTNRVMAELPVYTTKKITTFGESQRTPRTL